MSIELRVPDLGEAVETATLSVWLKQQGDAVEAGEPIVELETEKTSVEIEVPVSGVLQKVHVEAGTDGLEPGTLLATISEQAAREVPPPAATPEPQGGAVDVATSDPGGVGSGRSDAADTSAPYLAPNRGHTGTPGQRTCREPHGPTNGRGGRSGAGGHRRQWPRGADRQGRCRASDRGPEGRRIRTGGIVRDSGGVRDQDAGRAGRLDRVRGAAAVNDAAGDGATAARGQADDSALLPQGGVHRGCGARDADNCQPSRIPNSG